MLLSYAYHCCFFANQNYEKEDFATTKMGDIQETIIFPTDNEFDMSLWNSTNTDIWPRLREFAEILLI